ncbi:MAG: hypothetical protein NTY08_17585 [Proteobacteria bacterium]|nr:hypothetical protein [Pseudomonadota bacterium]
MKIMKKSTNYIIVITAAASSLSLFAACKPASQNALSAAGGSTLTISWEQLEANISLAQQAAPGSELSFESMRKIPAAKIFAPDLKSNRRIQFGDVVFDGLDEIMKGGGKEYSDYVGRYKTLGDYFDSQGIKSSRSVSIASLKNDMKRLKQLLREEQFAGLNLADQDGLKASDGNDLALLGPSKRNCIISGLGAFGSALGTTLACGSAIFAPTPINGGYCVGGSLGLTGAINGAVNTCHAYRDEKNSRTKKTTYKEKDEQDKGDNEGNGDDQKINPDNDQKDKKG